MDQRQFASLYKQFIQFLSTNVENKMVKALESDAEDGIGPRVTVNRVLKEALASIPDVATSTPSSPSSTGTKSAIASAAVLVDEKGVPRACTAVTKKNAPCTNKAKVEAGNGSYLCGLHARSGANSQADPNKKPTTSAPAKGSSFESTVNASAYNAFNIDNTDVDDIIE